MNYGPSRVRQARPCAGEGSAEEIACEGGAPGAGQTHERDVPRKPVSSVASKGSLYSKSRSFGQAETLFPRTVGTVFDSTWGLRKENAASQRAETLLLIFI